MKKSPFSTKGIALAGLGAALSLVFVVLAYYIRFTSLALNIFAAAGMLLPLSQKYYKETLLAYAAVCGLGAIIVNIKILSFVLVGGFYSILTVFLRDKKEKIKPIVAYPIKIAYSCLVFCVVYYLTDILVVDIDGIAAGANFDFGLSSGWLYLILNLIFSGLYLLYDALFLWAVDYYAPKIEKITKNIGKR